MHALIIEDNDLKFKLVDAFLHEQYSHLTTERTPSYQSGIEALVKREYAFVVLDMTLPVFDPAHSPVTTDVLTFGGELILRESQRRHIKAHFIVLSQYDTFVRDTKEVTFEELRRELLDKYKDIVLGCVRLDSTSVHWKAELKSLIIVP